MLLAIGGDVSQCWTRVAVIGLRWAISSGRSADRAGGEFSGFQS